MPPCLHTHTSPPQVALARARVLIRGGSQETIKTLCISLCAYLKSTPATLGTCMAAHTPGGTDTDKVPCCISNTHAGAVGVPRRLSRLFPTGGDILGSMGDGHAAPAAWGDARCSRLMKAALCPLAGCSTGPSWESKWVCPQIKQPQTEL